MSRSVGYNTFVKNKTAILWKKVSKNMDSKLFIETVKKIIVDYVNNRLDKTDCKKITVDDVFIVWQCKILKNNKALASTTISDGMYYEITYNGKEDEFYLDAYKKWENLCIQPVNAERKW